MRVACIQCTATDSLEENLALLAPMIAEAAAEGATFITLPENALLMASGEAFHTQVYPESEHPALAHLQEQVVAHGIHLLIGSAHIKQGADYPQDGKYVNRSLLIGPSGAITARYDKIHLFDVSLPGGETHKESERFHGGSQAVVAPVGDWQLGLTICYDVRFPHLYTALADAGAQMLTVPAAFTYTTGSYGHWHVLLRARAIETGCYVIAPAQCGTHRNGRRTYGHSLIIDPMGTILAEAAETPALIYADCDRVNVTEARTILPVLQNRRAFR